MSTLSDRIRGKWVTPDAQPMAIAKDYGAPTAIPLRRVAIYPNGFAYDEPIITADGAPSSNTGWGQWGQLYAVGRA